jgi:hypothetical protein
MNNSIDLRHPSVKIEKVQILDGLNLKTEKAYFIKK